MLWRAADNISILITGLKVSYYWLSYRLQWCIYCRLGLMAINYWLCNLCPPFCTLSSLWESFACCCVCGFCVWRLHWVPPSFYFKSAAGLYLLWWYVLCQSIEVSDSTPLYKRLILFTFYCFCHYLFRSILLFLSFHIWARSLKSESTRMALGIWWEPIYFCWPDQSASIEEVGWFPCKFYKESLSRAWLCKLWWRRLGSVGSWSKKMGKNALSCNQGGTPPIPHINGLVSQLCFICKLLLNNCI